MLKRDRSNKLYYASLQGRTAKQELDPFHIDKVDTIIFKTKDRIHFQSSASLREIGELGGIYSLMKVFLIVPPFIRNWIYGIISKNRYRWFGRQETCRMPTNAEKGRLLE